MKSVLQHFSCSKTRCSFLGGEVFWSVGPSVPFLAEGVCLMQLDRMDEAMVAFSRVLSINDEDTSRAPGTGDPIRT